MSWTDMAFCFMAAASNHHMDDLGCTCTPFWPNNMNVL
jgi:hypothetical protein